MPSEVVTGDAPDQILVNGRIWAGLPAPGATAEAPTDQTPRHEALAIRDGRVLALGSTRQILALAGSRTELVDLQHRTVVPGLIDGHIHAVRAGPTWSSELHWSGIPRLAEALDSVRQAAATASPGQWISAVGGWHPCQFQENRPPTRAELDQVAPDHPVYVQGLYEVAVLNTAAARAVGLDDWGDVPAGIVERDPGGNATGVVRGLGAFTRCLAALPELDTAAQQRSTAAMLADFHAVGLTGLNDPGGFGMTPERYEPLFALWRTGELTARIRLFLSATTAGQELPQVEAWLGQADRLPGDDQLRTVGIGEVVHFGCHDFEGLEPFEVDHAAYAELRAITRRVAESGRPMHIHAVLDATIDRILDAWESVNREIPLDSLRFSLAHADTISARNIRRLRALGAGVVLDDHQVFRASASQRSWGQQAMASAPPIGDLAEAGVPLGAGTDATRASSYNPWLALWWLVEGRNLDGTVERGTRHRLSRERALHLYTRGSAWFSFEDSDRGHLYPGAHADFAVLSDDYFSIPADRIPSLTSDLTAVGGRPVHGSVGLTTSAS